MTKKVSDLAVVTGSYTDREGNKKNRYKTVGSLMAADDGSQFILLERTFNPAGVPNPEGRDTLLISIFEPREEKAQSAHSKAKADGYAPGEDESDLPF